MPFLVERLEESRANGEHTPLREREVAQPGLWPDGARRAEVVAAEHRGRVGDRPDETGVGYERLAVGCSAMQADGTCAQGDAREPRHAADHYAAAPHEFGHQRAEGVHP